MLAFRKKYAYVIIKDKPKKLCMNKIFILNGGIKNEY